jgi:hypothetical protein
LEDNQTREFRIDPVAMLIAMGIAVREARAPGDARGGSVPGNADMYRFTS